MQSLSSPAAAIALLLTLCLGLALSERSASADRLPNLIVILSDDQGYRDTGFNGSKDIPTPHTDRIANEGVRFTNGYVTYAVCGPSRAGLITGRYQDRFGAILNPIVDPSVPNNGVPTSEKNIAELLKPLGYTTMTVGKWHLGTHPDLRPHVRGFDEFYGFLSGGHDYFPENLTLEDLSEVDRQWAWYRTKLLHNGKRVGTDAYLTEELSDAAVDFIERKKDEPFFLYLSYNAPHTPMQATDEDLARFSHIENERRRTYAAMVASMDDGIGRVLDTLDELGLAEDTIVFFLSDNGGASNNAANNWPLKGHKGSPHEGGLRVPFAVRWTGTYPAGVDFDHPVLALDIAGTIAGQAGASVPADKPLDGVDLTPFLTGDNDGAPHDALYWRWYKAGRLVIRRGDHKLIVHGDNRQLYDLSADIGESNNLIDANPQLADELQAEVEAWAEDMVGPIAPGLGSWKF
ncbi:MAG: sulfatase-like hydrolase/transferase [Planctomycetota bacterium]